MPDATKTPVKSSPIDPRVWKGAFILISLTLLASFFSWEISGFLALVTLGHFIFFRDPSFKLPEGEGIIASPAYGHVADIEIVEETKFLQEKAYRIGIFMSFLDPHITRSPLDGKIGYLEYVPGKFINAMLKNCSLKNESNWIGIEQLGTRIMVRQITGAIARRIFWDVEIGSEVEAGEKIGVICYGSRVECYLPVQLFKPSVQIGQKVSAGSTILGSFDIVDAGSEKTGCQQHEERREDVPFAVRRRGETK